MREINNGGPAFPLPSAAYDYPIPGETELFGMSVRDAMAIAAVNGMLAHSTRYRPRVGAPENWHEAIAEEAYQIADAMLAARSQP